MRHPAIVAVCALVSAAGSATPAAAQGGVDPMAATVAQWFSMVERVAIWHATDHYGQLVVYLRMNGIVPPASAAP